MAPPVGVGLAAFLETARRQATGAGWVRVTTLTALPADGVPRKFAVIADRQNAWNRQRAVPIGAVYLRRTGGWEIEAFNVICPHAGCLVTYSAERKGYLCPCHNSTFGLDGSIRDPASPAPRGLDPIEVEVRGEGEVWVRYRRFLTGRKERIEA